MNKRRALHPRIAALALVGLFLAALGVTLMTGLSIDRAQKDQDRYHLAAIERFSDQWPHFDFSDYESATTPGYHVAIATIRHWVTTDTITLRLASSLFTVGLLLTLGMTLGHRVRPLEAIALGAPVLCSQYVFASGAWLLPDNAAWWGVLAMLLFAYRPRFSAATLLAGAVVLAALVLVRQIHLWTAGLLWVWAWLDAWPDDGRDESLLKLTPARGKRLAMAILVTAPAVLIVVWFARLWGGALTPPMFQMDAIDTGKASIGTVDVTGGNPAAPALILTIIGAFSVFYIGYLIDAARSAWAERRGRVLLVGASLSGLLISAAPASSYSFADGRWSGVWNIVRKLPTVADRSPLIVAGGALGAAMLSLWFMALGKRDRWVFISAWAGFAVAQSVNALAWQRYIEPFALLMFAVAASRIKTAEDHTKRRLIGPAVLGALSAALTIFSLT